MTAGRRDGRRFITPTDVGYPSCVYALYTVARGFWRTLRSGERYAIIVFREPARDGACLDFRLNLTDLATLRRIYGEPRAWLNEYVVLEVRETAFMGTNRAPRVRVASPARWRECIPEVLPVAFDGDAPLKTVDSPSP